MYIASRHTRSVMWVCWIAVLFHQVTAAFDGASRGWTVNPFKAMRSVTGAAGFVAPSFVRENIKILEEIFGIDDAQWTVFEKTVVLKNCVIGFKNHTQPALRVGRLALHWDSVTAPTIDIEVEDVDVSVEFTNLLMTRNNWNEVIDGVSPLLSSYDAASRWFDWDADSEDQDDFLHFNSMGILGNITMRLSSRPLKKELGNVALSIDIDDLTAEISKASERNFQLYGKRGCSTAELTTILKRYFTKRFGGLVKSIAADPHEAIARANSILDRAKGIVIDYTHDTRTETLRRLGRLLAVHLQRYSEKVTKFVVRLSRKVHRLCNTLRSRLGLGMLPEPPLLLKYTNNTETEQTEEKQAKPRWRFSLF